MSEYHASVIWQRGTQSFLDNKYSRGHQWHFDGGAIVAASSSPHIVPLPYSVEENVDPEEAFIASLSSCHMLFFLSLAAKAGWLVERYSDNAIGYMQQEDDGAIWMAKVILRPEITFGGEAKPTQQQLERLHHQAHQKCFIANSVKTVIEITSIPQPTCQLSS
jgi:organic hydroperoxide reductase OsmC/OhrA